MRTAYVNRQKGKLHNKSLNMTWSIPCPHCGFVYLNSMTESYKRDLCCNNGRLLQYPQYSFQPLTTSMEHTLSNNLKHVSTSSYYYNNILALAATAVDTKNDPVDERKWISNFGSHAVKLHGRTTHFLPNTSLSKSGIQFFTFHSLGTPSMEHVPMAVQDLLDDNMLKYFKEYLIENNPYVRDCIAVGDYVTQQHENDDSVMLCEELNQRTSKFDVGSVSALGQEGNRCVVYKVKTDEEWSIDSALRNTMEPLCYPLLFQHGEIGWGYQEDHKTIDLRTYLSSRILRPEYVIDPENTFEPNHLFRINNVHDEPVLCNRLQAMAKLGQAYVTDMVSRMIDYHLRYHEKNQKMYFGNQATNDDEDGGDCDADIGENNAGGTTANDPDSQENPKKRHKYGPSDQEKIFLGDLFHGGRRHLKKCSMQGLRVIAEYGPPTIFVTLTANPNWDEIVQKIGKGQTAYERADVTNMVFKEKLEALINNIKSGKYFNGAVPVYMMYVIEWQERGLPHAHIIIRLTNHPNKEDIERFMDDFICAERVAVSTTDSEVTKKYKQYVDQYMIHKCYSVDEGGCLRPDGSCRRNYNKVPIDVSHVDERGFPKYRRRELNVVEGNSTAKDLCVVPHSREILLDWNGHANVELCSSGYAITYLYRYLYKGAKCKSFEMSRRYLTDDNEPIRNEITLYICGRYLCASEAIWRAFKYLTYPPSSPSVLTIKVITQDELAESKHHTWKCIYEDRVCMQETPLWTFGRIIGMGEMVV